MNQILTDDQIETLILNLGASRGDEGFEEADAQKVVDWAQDVLIGSGLLANVLDGYIGVNVKDGEVVFHMTERGKSAAAALHPPQTEKLQ